MQSIIVKFDWHHSIVFCLKFPIKFGMRVAPRDLMNTFNFCNKIFRGNSTGGPNPRFRSSLLVIVKSALRYCTACDSASLSDYMINTHVKLPYCIVSHRIATTISQPASTDSSTLPRCRWITFGHRTFSVAGPMVWNTLHTDISGSLT